MEQQPCELPVSPEVFYWATGIEDTFVAQSGVGRRRLDLYELQQHYQRWQEDLDLAGELGVQMIRYGIPWYRVNPAPGRFDWSFVDQVLEYMIGQKGIVPIVDLMHYGCPLWLEGQFIHPDYPAYVAEYAATFAERYAPLGVRYFTPLNEPYVNAEFCGLIGRWPPYLTGDEGFVAMFRQLCRGIITTVTALRQVVPDSIMVHVDATGVALADDCRLEPEAARRNATRFTMFELVQGRVQEGHFLHRWLTENGISDADLAWFSENRIDIDIMGLNYYPELTVSKLAYSEGRVEAVPHWGGGDCLRQLIKDYWKRYQRPIFITETSTNAKVGDRVAWLHESVGVVRELRQEGVPVIGYTWWPLYDLINWDYREGSEPVAAYIEPMGLWSLVPDDSGALRREAHPAAAAYRQVIAANPVGIIGGGGSGSFLQSR